MSFGFRKVLRILDLFGRYTLFNASMVTSYPVFSKLFSESLYLHMKETRSAGTPKLRKNDFL